MVKPYLEIKFNNQIIRTFDSLVNEDELIWHRDKNDRLVRVISGDEWQLQLDNELPVELVKGKDYMIPKEVYHRLIKGKSSLTLKILES